MIKYKCFFIKDTGENTEDELNKLAQDGWKVICSFASRGQWLLLEKKDTPWRFNLGDERT